MVQWSTYTHLVDRFTPLRSPMWRHVSRPGYYLRLSVACAFIPCFVFYLPLLVEYTNSEFRKGPLEFVRNAKEWRWVFGLHFFAGVPQQQVRRSDITSLWICEWVGIWFIGYLVFKPHFWTREKDFCEWRVFVCFIQVNICGECVVIVARALNLRSKARRFESTVWWLFSG